RPWDRGSGKSGNHLSENPLMNLPEVHSLQMYLSSAWLMFPNRRFIDCPAASMPITSPDFFAENIG
ncbi:hypothetical protein ABK720_18375, partial [Enterobacter hormaechei]|uniref:hypothetical protein n=1 Tax=Enterobacter hormaechei TaxID=158836 RepID=UPI00375153E2